MRRLAALLAVALLVVPSSASAAAAETAGISETSVDLGAITLGDLGVETLGSASALATSAGEAPASLARVALPLGQEFEVSSADEAEVPPQTAELPGLGSVSVAGLVADADDRSATAAVEALAAELNPLGLQLGSHAGFGSQVDDAGTLARNGVALSGLNVSLTDLLGQDVLAELPLSVLLDLGSLLGLDLAGLGAGQLEQVIEQLDAAGTLAAQIDSARAAVATARTAVSDAEAAVTAAQATATATAAAVTAKQQEITSLQNQIGGLACAVVAALCSQLQAAQAELVTLQAQAAGAQDAVAAATAALDAARAALQPAEAALNALLDQVDALLDGLLALLEGLDGLDLSALLEQLRDGLAGVELLAVDELAVTVQTSADAEHSGAEASCSVEGVRVAGQAVAVDACRELGNVLDGVVADIIGVLEQLPIDAAQLPQLPELVSATAPTLSVTEADAVRDGAQIAEARVTGLGLQVASLNLTDLLSEDVLTPIIDEALPDLAAIPGVDTAAVTAALEALRAEVLSLPVGDLAGLATPALELAPASAVAASQFGVGLTGPGATPGGSGDTGTPPADAPTLPATGGGIAGGIVLLGLGAGAAAWLRRGRR